LPEPIRCLKVDERHIYAAAGNMVYAFMQGRKVCIVLFNLIYCRVFDDFYNGGLR